MEGGDQPRFYLTFDTEWSNQDVIDDTVNMVKENGSKATFFLTDDFPEIKYDNVELAQHPNIENKTVDEVRTHLEKLFQIQPVRGIRCHKLYNSSILNMALRDMGIEYQVNYMNFLQPNIEAFIGLCGIVEVPMFFMDYYLLDFYKGVPRYETLRDKFLSPGIKVIDFHPIEIYMNLPSLDFYYEHRDDLKVNTETYGIRNFFQDMLQDLNAENTHFVRDLVDGPFDIPYTKA